MVRHLLPLELVLWIWQFCPPPTLLTFTSTCKWFHGILTKDTRLGAHVWSRARLNCLHEIPCPPQGVSEYKHALLIFGNSLCYICQKPTSTFPVSYALQIKLCNSYKCYYELRDHHLEIDDRTKGSIVFKKMLFWLENDAVRRLGYDVKFRYTMECHSDPLWKEYQRQQDSLTSNEFKKWYSAKVCEKIQRRQVRFSHLVSHRLIRLFMW
ncbi:hypothetical protein M422DRAFT_28942 [Sphaerobolus stellatus SS14]|nr:hypothetical protein M422DRAFT_28942 [Sphaerobolus stellatus SS14]